MVIIATGCVSNANGSYDCMSVDFSSTVHLIDFTVFSFLDKGFSRKPLPPLLEVFCKQQGKASVFGTLTQDLNGPHAIDYGMKQINIESFNE